MVMPAEELEKLCFEAVKAHGDDWPAVEKAVTERLANMPAGRRAAILKAVSEPPSYVPARRGGVGR